MDGRPLSSPRALGNRCRAMDSSKFLVPVLSMGLGHFYVWVKAQ
jgi:hypothetical protein